MVDFQQKAVRTVISSASLMTLLTSDHLKCHCSAVAISIQFNKADHHLWGLHEASHHVCVKSAMNSAHLMLHDFDLTFTRNLDQWFKISGIFHLSRLLYNAIMLAMLNWHT
jgi:hypothetical protein